jgi:hypothetical protein
MMQDEQHIAGPLGGGGRGEHPLRLAHIALGHSREKLGLLGKDALGQVDVAHRPALRTWMLLIRLTRFHHQGTPGNATGLATVGVPRSPRFVALPQKPSRHNDT